jgi:hypothetical protein
MGLEVICFDEFTRAFPMKMDFWKIYSFFNLILLWNVKQQRGGRAKCILRFPSDNDKIRTRRSNETCT